MTKIVNKIRKLVLELEADANAIIELREWAKHDVKLNKFGSALVEAGFENEVPQAVLARILDVSPAAIARRYAELGS